MKFANIRELKINSNTILRSLAREDVVITRNGKPVAAVIYMDEDLLDSFIVAHHPTLLRGIDRDLARWRRGSLRTIGLEDVRRRLSAARGRRRRTG